MKLIALLTLAACLALVGCKQEGADTGSSTSPSTNAAPKTP